MGGKFVFELIDRQFDLRIVGKNGQMGFDVIIFVEIDLAWGQFPLTVGTNIIPQPATSEASRRENKI